MDVHFTDILVEGERILDDDENFFHSVPKLDAPHSAPQSRSSSFRNRPRPRLNLDIQAAQRPRTNSLPNTYLPLPDPFHNPESGGLHRIRSFKTTSKGLVNHGDSFQKSTSSLASAGSAASLNGCGGRSPRRQSSDSDENKSEDAQEPPSNIKLSLKNLYRVLMMGSPGVGKTALTRQFMTSEYKGTYTEANSPDIVESKRNVTVLLDGQESTLHFLDEEQHPDFEEEELPIDAYVVVFSVSNTASYNQAVKSIRTLREEHKINKATILVGNKIDIARQRRVARHDALRVAKKYDCRYIETSAALNHHVDELLVGVLSQIRMQVAPSSSGLLAPPQDAKHRSRSKSAGRAISNFFSKLFGGGDKKAKSCETLFVQ